jgi:hypothetical protein
VGAARLVLGTVSIPPSLDARLGGNVVLEGGEVVEPALTEGELTQLLELQKDYSARVAEALGYGLTEEERRRMEENRPANLRALLAFSRGLMAEDAGDFAGAAAHFQDALSADPQYGDAQQRFRSAVGADVVSRVAWAKSSRWRPGWTRPWGLVPEPSVPRSCRRPPSQVCCRAPWRCRVRRGLASVRADPGGRGLRHAFGLGDPFGNQVVPPLEAILTIIITIPR